jgi:O-antigen ligase
MMSGPKNNTWVTYLGAFIVFASLCLPVITLRSTLPSIHILDICFPVMLGLILVNRTQLATGYGAWIPFVFSGFVLFSIVIQTHHTSLSDYFEVYKWIKFGVVIWFFSLLDYSLFKRFIPWIFGILVLINTIHFFEFTPLNKILEHYYNGGLQIRYFGKDSLGGPAVKRLVGTMGNPNINALLFGFFSLYYFPIHVNRKNLGLFFLSLLFVFLCQSRTALFFFFCIFVFLAVFKPTIWTKKQWGFVMTGTISTFFIAWMLATSFFQFTSYNNSLLDGTVFHSGSVRGRLETWNMLGKMILEEPIFGHGPYKEFFYKNKIYSENEYILMSWRYGLPGLLIYLSIFLIPFKKLVTSMNEKSLKGSLMLIVMMVSAMTNNPLTERNIELLFCIGIAWIFQRHQTKESAYA